MKATLAFAVAGLLAAACGSSPAASVSATPTPSTPAVVAVEVKTVKGQQEPVLVNASAQTLYYLTSDTSTTVACTGQCATFWPPLLLPSGDPFSGTSLPGKLSVLADANGRQVLYNGHPLYAFVKDKASGDANGEGVNAFGGTWHPATPALAAM
jgi:predicted lipoprotein with Yx(FWY)xxD motif